MAANKNRPKRTERHGQVAYEVPAHLYADDDIPQHLIDKEQAKAKTERWRARLGL